jgi:hypothetical protein
VLTNGVPSPLTSSSVSLTRWTIPGTYSALVESYKPAAYYRLSEASGTTIYDIANCFDGVTSGSVARMSGPVPTDLAGFETGNQANNLAGGAYLPVGGPAIAGNNVTITLWIKPNSNVQVPYSGLYYSRGADYAGLHFGKGGNTKLAISWNGHYDDDSKVTVKDGEWNFAALVVKPGSATFYSYNVNYGWLSNSIIASFPVRNLAGGTTCIGIDPNFTSRYINGVIDEVAVMNTALEYPDIEKLAMAGQYVHVSILPAGAGFYQLGWSYGTLQWADSVGGVYTDVPGAAATSYLYNATGFGQKYFRSYYTP